MAVWCGYIQAELSRLVGVAASTISHLESGKGTANFVTVAKLAGALDISREQLLHDEPATVR